MTKKQWLAGFALVDLMAINVYAAYHYGLVGFLREAASSLAGIAVLADLAIAIGLIAVWMWNDARKRGISPLPYLITSLFLGSVGPLAYVLRTGGDTAGADERIALHAAARG